MGRAANGVCATLLVVGCASESAPLLEALNEPEPGRTSEERNAGCLIVRGDMEQDLLLQPSVQVAVDHVSRRGDAPVPSASVGPLTLQHLDWGGWNRAPRDANTDLIPGPHRARFCADYMATAGGCDESLVEVMGPTLEVRYRHVPVEVTLVLDEGRWPEPSTDAGDLNVTFWSEAGGLKGSTRWQLPASNPLRLNVDLAPGAYRVIVSAQCLDGGTPCGAADVGAIEVTDQGRIHTIRVRTARLFGDALVDGRPLVAARSSHRGPLWLQPLGLPEPEFATVPTGEDGGFDVRVFAGRYHVRYENHGHDSIADPGPLANVVWREDLDLTSDHRARLRATTTRLDLLLRGVEEAESYDGLLLWLEGADEPVRLPLLSLREGRFSGLGLGRLSRVEFVPRSGGSCHPHRNLPCVGAVLFDADPEPAVYDLTVEAHPVTFEIDLAAPRTRAPGDVDWVVLRSVDVSARAQRAFWFRRYPSGQSEAAPWLMPGRYEVLFYRGEWSACASFPCPAISLGTFVVDGPMTVRRSVDLFRVRGRVGAMDGPDLVAGIGQLGFTPQGASSGASVWRRLGATGQFDVSLPPGAYAVEYAAGLQCGEAALGDVRPCASQIIRRCDP